MRVAGTLWLVLFLLSTTFFSASASLVETGGSNELLAMCLEFYKWDEYLPGIDLLEQSAEGLEDSFNYWLYLGLGYQRTGQTEKAIKAYEKAYSINSSAGNLSSRIRALRIETKRLDYQKTDLAQNTAKADYLMNLARKLRKEYQLDRSFRLFLQALNYNPDLLGRDEGFITEAEVFYGLKKVAHAEFFQGLFQLMQGDIEHAEKNLNAFLKSQGKKPAIFLARAEDGLKKISMLKEAAVVAKVSERKLAASERITALPGPVKGVKIAVKKQNDTNENVETIEQEINAEESGRFIVPDSGFVEFFAAEVARKTIAELSQARDVERQCRLIWELGNSRLQNSEVMSALISQFESTEIEVLNMTMEAVGKIGAPSAEAAIDNLIAFIEHEDPLIKFLAIETLGKIKEQPEKVIPVLVKDYAEENDLYLKRNIYYWVNKFGKPGLRVLYNELEATDRIDRKPIAELISRITGEKIQSLIDR